MPTIRETTRPDDADDRPRASRGSALRTHLEALPGESRSVRLAFARAWYKLTHRDMGPVRAIWPVGTRSHSRGRTPFRRSTTIPSVRRHRGTQGRSSRRDCPSPNWSPPRGRRPRRFAAPTSAGRQRCSPPTRAPEGLGSERPAEVTKVLRTLEGSSRTSTNRTVTRGLVGRRDRPRRSAAVEQAAKSAGYDVTVPFTPGRTDASRRTRTKSPSTCWSRHSTGSATTSVTVTSFRRETAHRARQR